jgi:hypothetical protein
MLAQYVRGRMHKVPLPRLHRLGLVDVKRDLVTVFAQRDVRLVGLDGPAFPWSILSK